MATYDRLKPVLALRKYHIMASEMPTSVAADVTLTAIEMLCARRGKHRGAIINQAKTNLQSCEVGEHLVADGEAAVGCK